MDETERAIASPHWRACDTCKFFNSNDCMKSCIDLSVYLGDWILCDDYERKYEN